MACPSSANGMAEFLPRRKGPPRKWSLARFSSSVATPIRKRSSGWRCRSAHPRSDRREGRFRRGRTKRCDPTRVEAGRLARPLDRRRVPQVRRVRGVEARQHGRPLGDDQRAADQRVPGIRVDPGGDGDQGTRDPFLPLGATRAREPRPRQRRGLRRGPRAAPPGPGRTGDQPDRLATPEPVVSGGCHGGRPRRPDLQPAGTT